MYEIPLEGPGFDVAELTRPVTAEDKETLALYERACNLYYGAVQKWVGTPEPGRTLSAAEKLALQKEQNRAVESALEASRRPLPRTFPEANVENLYAAREHELALLVFESAEPLQSEGKLDAALERYVAVVRIAVTMRRQSWNGVGSANNLELRACEQLAGWAAQGGQTPQRVLAGLRSMEQQWGDPPSCCDVIKRRYLWDLDLLLTDQTSTRNELPSLTFALGLPWERARTIRLYNQLTQVEFARCTDSDKELAAGGFVARPSPISDSPVVQSDITYRRVRPLVEPYATYAWESDELRQCLEVETYRRATRLILALEAWKLEHGRLPKLLDDLKGKYFDQLPVSPYSGGAFLYEPKGLTHPQLWQSSQFSKVKTLEPDRPFIACDQWSNALNSINSAGCPELLGGVWIFPIPSAKEEAKP